MRTYTESEYRELMRDRNMYYSQCDNQLKVIVDREKTIKILHKKVTRYGWFLIGACGAIVGLVIRIIA